MAGDRSAGLCANDYGDCAKTDLCRARRSSSRMRSLRRVEAVVAAVLVLAVIGVTTGTASGSSPGAALSSLASPGPADLTLSNGLVSVSFARPQPVLTMHSNDSPVLLSQALQGLAEVNGSGGIVAWAQFDAPGLNWTVVRAELPHATTAVFSAIVPVLGASGEWESGDRSSDAENGSLGSVNVSIAFVLNATLAPSPRTLAYGLNVSGWPWQYPNDSLGLEVRTSASGASGLWEGIGPSGLRMRASSGNTTLASFAWGTSAVARYGGGGEQDSFVESYRNTSAGGLDSLVRLNFALIQGGYESLEFDPWLSLYAMTFPGSLPAWVFTPAALGVIGAGLALTVGLAVYASVRRRPPDRDL